MNMLARHYRRLPMDPQEFTPRQQAFTHPFYQHHQHQRQLHRSYTQQQLQDQQEQHKQSPQQQPTQQLQEQHQQHNQSQQQHERRSSSLELTSRRTDRRQPIIIQNFEILPPGQKHLKRRSLSTANLFLSSASLRREVEIQNNSQVSESSQIHNDSNRPTQPPARELPLNHQNGRAVSAAVSSSQTPSVSKEPSTVFNESRSSARSQNSDIRPVALEYLSRTYGHIPENGTEPRQDNKPVTNTVQNKGLENGSHKNVTPPNISTKPEPELSRANSYPTLSTQHGSPRKTKSKKQVTFADSVPVPWPYTLVQDGKMWSTESDSVPIHRTPFPKSYRFTDMNNNMDSYSPCTTRYEANIFRPMADNHVHRDKNTPKAQQGILKKRKTADNQSRNDSPKALPEETYNVMNRSTRFGENRLTIEADSCSETHKSKTQNPTKVEVQGNELDTTHCGIDDVESNHSNSLHFQETTLPNHTEVDENSNFIRQNSLSRSQHAIGSHDNIAQADIGGTLTVSDQDTQSALKSAEQKDEIVGFETRVIKNSEVKNNPFDENLACSPDVLGSSVESEKIDTVGVEGENNQCSDELLAPANVCQTTQASDRTPGVTAYTVPQLVDSVDLSDYLSTISGQGGHAAKSVSDAFRPRPNNARLYSKPDVTPAISNTANDSSRTHTNKATSNTDNTTVLRLKFLKDEKDTNEKKDKNSSLASASNGAKIRGKLEDSDTLSMAVAGKGLQLAQPFSIVNTAGQEPAETSSVPERPMKPFKGRPGEIYRPNYTSKPKTQGELNTDYLMRMYSATGERQCDTDSTITKSVDLTSAGAIHTNNISTTTEGVSRPPSGLTQRSRIAATVTTAILPSPAVYIDEGYSSIDDRQASGDSIRHCHSARRSRESKRDMLNRKLAVTRGDAFALTPRSRETQRRLLTASLVGGDPPPELVGEATFPPRAVLQARARSSSASGSQQRGRNLSAHERTLGAMENAFFPGRLKSAGAAAGVLRAGVRGSGEGGAISVGRTHLNRRLEMLVLSSTRPNTAIERSRSNMR